VRDEIPPPQLFVLSGRSMEALRGQAQRLQAHVVGHAEQSLSDVAYSLAASRTAFERRGAVVARERSELLEGLASLSEGHGSARVVLGEARAAGKVAFVFPGQGSQWVGMARALLEQSEPFAAQMLACERALAPYLDVPLLKLIEQSDIAALERVAVVQPILFSVMVSLAALWRSHGVQPDAVVGHSQGEIAAAYVCGALSLEDAVRVVALRSQLLERLAGQGSMAAIELGAQELEQRYLGAYPGRLTLAAVNSPEACVVAGERTAVSQLLAQLEADQVLARRVASNVAGHCAQLDPLEPELRTMLAQLTPRTAPIPLYSTVLAAPVAGEQLDAGYWFDNARQPVRFQQTIEALLGAGHRHFVEVSPHPVLTHALRCNAQAAAAPVSVVGTLRRDLGSRERFLLALGEAHAGGLPLDPKRVWNGTYVALPTYAFQHQRYWPAQNPLLGNDVSAAGLTAAEHPLLGASLPLADDDGLLLTGRLNHAQPKWLS
jgi:acyl transferase domain-containing protein